MVRNLFCASRLLRKTGILRYGSAGAAYSGSSVYTGFPSPSPLRLGGYSGIRPSWVTANAV